MLNLARGLAPIGAPIGADADDMRVAILTFPEAAEIVVYRITSSHRNKAFGSPHKHCPISETVLPGHMSYLRDMHESEKRTPCGKCRKTCLSIVALRLQSTATSAIGARPGEHADRFTSHDFRNGICRCPDLGR